MPLLYSVLSNLGDLFKGFWENTGIYGFLNGYWANIIMILIALLLLYLAIFKGAEPYLLIPIAVGALLSNLPGSEIFEEKSYNIFTIAAQSGMSVDSLKGLFTSLFEGMRLADEGNLLKLIPELKNDIDWNTFSLTASQIMSLIKEMNLALGDESSEVFKAIMATSGSAEAASELLKSSIVALSNVEKAYSGLLGVLYLGVSKGIYPCLIFMGIGATTDFGPLIANPKTMILGAAAQIGIFVTFLGALALGFDAKQASSIGIIGGADGPTAILVTKTLAPELLSSIAIAAYSYMALVPFIQPPIIRLLTTKKERLIKMDELKPVSQTKKILFPIIVTVVVVLLIPSCADLIGCLMLGNLIKESKVVPKLTEAAGNTILYTVTILLGLTVGATAKAETFLTVQTLGIFALGIFAFATATAGGVLIGKLMSKLSGGKINPMIGAAGVSAVPMAARVVHLEGLKEDPSNYLLMSAMGPNVAGVIGSAVAAGLLMMLFG